MSGKIHCLKTWPEYFNAVESGEKTFEIRNNDRNFKVKDLIILQEYKPHDFVYTGRQIIAEITYITNYEQKEGFVVMSFKKMCA